MHEVCDGGYKSDDSELEVWDESSVAAVETRIRKQRREDPKSVTQWGNAYFRPGTAPEAETNAHSGYTDSTPKKTSLSSPPTSLSEVNFALRSAARQAQKHKSSSSRPPSGTQKHDIASRVSRSGDKRERGVRSGSSSGLYILSPQRVDPTANRLVDHMSPGGLGLEMCMQNREDRSAYGGQSPGTPSRGVSPGTTSRVPPGSTGTPVEGTRKTIRSTSKKSDSRQDRKNANSPSSQSRPPPKPASPAPVNAPTNKSISQSTSQSVSKQRKAASARLTRPELPIHALYSQVYQEQGAPLPQSHPQMFFQKRSRPPSRHRSPQDSLGLDVQPQPIPPRMRSAHERMQHERPPSRCKPPPEALHLEDAVSDDEEAERRAERPSSSRSKRGPTPRPDQVPKRPVSGTPSRTACQGEFDRPNPQTPEPDTSFPDGGESSSDEADADAEWGTARSRSLASRKKTPAANVPFRTSLSPDFLRLFAPSSSAAPPTPPKTQMAFNNHHHPQDELFSDPTITMGLTDIPSPTHDLFGPFADKELFNKTFEDLCISDDDSEQSL